MIKLFLVLCVSLGLTGCAGWFSAKTRVAIPIIGEGPDGQRIVLGTAEYESTKEQTDFHAEYNPESGRWEVSTAKASTNEQAIIESSKATQQALGLLGQALKMAPVPGP